MTTTGPSGTNATGRRAPRWMWVVLIASLCINLAVLGMGLAAATHFNKRDGGLGEFMSQLPSEKRATVEAMLAERRETMRGLRSEARTARRVARDAFQAEPFDQSRLEQAFASAAQARSALITARGDWVVKMAALLNAEERRAYIEWRAKRHKGGKRWRRRGDSDDQ